MLNSDLLTKHCKVVMVVGHDNHYAIGKDGGLIVVDKADMRWFKRFTTGHICIVGKNTYEEVCDLPDRIWICLTKDVRLHTDPNIETASNLNAAISKARSLAALHLRGDIILAGGAQTYNCALEADIVDEIWATVHPFDGNGDIVINSYDQDDRFVLVESYPLYDSDATFATDQKDVPMVKHYVRKRV